MFSNKKIKIGTRGSKLAIIQAELVKEQIIKATFISPDDIELVLIQTMGDLITDRPLSSIGGKSLFTKEIENALLRNEIDIAVHSLKDFTARIPEELTIRAYLKRADYRDAVVSPHKYTLLTLPKNATIGTSSCRRKAQLLEIRSDLNIVSLRGNVITRLNKVLAGEVDAAILAMAGLERLEIANDLFNPIEVNQMLPAPGQGMICVECRKDDLTILEICDLINDNEASLMALAEKGYSEALEADCNVPLAALAHVTGNIISLECHLYSIDGKEKYVKQGTDILENSYNLGYEIGKSFKKYLK
jgi:hydroxymethylbilane synthase